MALTTLNDSREALRQSYGGVFEALYGMRRNIHHFIVGMAIIFAIAPALWWLWLPLIFFLYAVDTDQQLRMQDRFGRGKGPYLKKKAGLKYGQIEEWSVISTPLHRGGDGIWPLGNNMHTQEEIWASDDHVRTHAVLSGTTGSGKTVTMSSTFIFVAMVSDSGVIMIDGKADPKTWFDLYAMAVAAGRADDFLVLNFVVGASQEAEFSFSSGEEKELWEEFQSIESNTFNIFGTGTADTLFEIGSGLLGDDATGDNKMWVERAQALLRSMLKALVDLRDQGQLKISIATLQEYMSLEKLSELEANPDISEIARQQVGAVLNEIAGYRDAMKVEDPQRRAALLADQPSKQFAFLHMQFGALYAMLIGTYGHIASVEYSDIYAPDVIRSRRILLVMLPALEKAPTSLAQLGRMATSAIKSALAQNISGSLTGRKAELVDRRPTNSTRAMVLIYDEAASYIQAGTADVASQSRSLGAFNIFSSQEWASFKQAGEIEATRLISNSGLKIVLKNEDKETADHFMNAVGEATVMKSGGKRWEKGKLIESERRLENVSRVTFQEMMNLAEGQAYIKWRDTMVLARMPFIPVKSVNHAQRNDLVPMPGSMPNDRLRMRQNKAMSKEVEQSSLPPLNLIDALAECQAEETDSESAAVYPLFEMITRILYSKQVVIPWESAPPPQGKVKVHRIYRFDADAMADDLMWALEKTDDKRLTPLKTLPKSPESRFVIPFLPHEEGLIDPSFTQDAEFVGAQKDVDDALSSTDEELSKELGEQYQEAVEAAETETAEPAVEDAAEPDNEADIASHMADDADSHDLDEGDLTDEDMAEVANNATSQWTSSDEGAPTKSAASAFLDDEPPESINEAVGEEGSDHENGDDTSEEDEESTNQGGSLSPEDGSDDAQGSPSADVSAHSEGTDTHPEEAADDILATSPFATDSSSKSGSSNDALLAAMQSEGVGYTEGSEPDSEQPPPEGSPNDALLAAMQSEGVGYTEGSEPDGEQLPPEGSEVPKKKGLLKRRKSAQGVHLTPRKGNGAQPGDNPNSDGDDTASDDGNKDD